MQLSQSLLILDAEAHAGNTLSKQTASKPAVRALQILLYSLGFGAELSWEKYRADGDFGGGTSSALLSFIKKNNLSGDGQKVSPELMAFMQDRQALLPALRELKSRLENGSLSGMNALALGMLVQALGFPENGFSSFASRNGSSSGQLTDSVAKALLTQVSALFGSGWETAGVTDPNARMGDATQATDSTKDVKVVDDWISVRFIKTRLGVYNYGEAIPAAFIQKNTEHLVEKGLSPSAIRVLLPVSSNEGNLDAINTWDDSFLTFGMFQWTVGQQDRAGELPGLLKRIKEEDPEAFMDNYGQYGIDVSPDTNNTGFLMLNGQKMSSTSDKGKFRDMGLTFRFWKAGLDPRVQLVQVKHAADRILSFRFNTKTYQPADKFAIGDLITSEYGMCLVLDQHVNRPGHLMKMSIGRTDIIGQAVKNAGLANTDPKTWGTAEETKLIEAYLPLRFASNMTHGEERANKILERVNRGELSRERNSFQMESTRSVRTRGLGEVPTYDLIDFEAYENRKKLPGRKRIVK